MRATRRFHARAGRVGVRTDGTGVQCGREKMIHPNSPSGFVPSARSTSQRRSDTSVERGRTLFGHARGSDRRMHTHAGRGRSSWLFANAQHRLRRTTAAATATQRATAAAPQRPHSQRAEPLRSDAVRTINGRRRTRAGDGPTWPASEARPRATRRAVDAPLVRHRLGQQAMMPAATADRDRRP